VSQKVSFSARGTFQAELKSRVNAYFAENALSKKGGAGIHFKAAIIFGIVALSYIYTVFLATSLAGRILGCIALAQGLALIGLNLMHEGAHGAYAESRRLNWLMGYTLDLLGGSNVMWRSSHNLSHHTYTNIDGQDVDLFSNGFLRFSPVQEWKPRHRFQWLYFPVIYGILTLWWVTTRDIEYFILKTGPKQVPRSLSLPNALLLVFSKAIYYTFALAIPLILHPAASVFAGFFCVHLMMGLTLTTIFQLAHTTENVAFPVADPATGEMPTEWSIHQIQTTTDFAPDSRLAAWYLGGLNFQVEHHLFPTISHVHYPAIRKIVMELCRERGIQYHCHPSFWSALRAHWIFMWKMGRAPQPAPIGAPGLPA